jgi:GDP-L-fucose synthase
MQAQDVIYVAGHRGLVGSALVRRLRLGGYTNLVLRSHSELDLTNQQAVNQFFNQEKPRHVFLAAAKVGGIHANNIYPADFLVKNLALQTHVMEAAYHSGVEKLLFLGSSCIYPRDCRQPMREEDLLSGSLEPTNEAYAIAKIAGIKLCSAYNRQYGTNYMSVMPTNLYGPGDNYDLENSHVVPAVIRKMHEAKQRDSAQVLIWGTGEPRREFLYSDDLADACVYLMTHHNARHIGEFVNVGIGQDLTIRELAVLVAEIIGYRGKLIFDTSRPDGTPRKLLDLSRLQALGWAARTPLREGLALVYRDFLRYHHLRK